MVSYNKCRATLLAVYEVFLYHEPCFLTSKLADEQARRGGGGGCTTLLQVASDAMLRPYLA